MPKLKAGQQWYPCRIHFAGCTAHSGFWFFDEIPGSTNEEAADNARTNWPDADWIECGQYIDVVLEDEPQYPPLF